MEKLIGIILIISMVLWFYYSEKMSIMLRNICCIIIMAVSILLFVSLSKMRKLNLIIFVVIIIATILAEYYPKHKPRINSVKRRQIVPFTQDLIFFTGSIMSVIEINELIYMLTL